MTLWDYSGGAPVRSLEEPEAAAGAATAAQAAGEGAATTGADGPTSMEVDGGSGTAAPAAGGGTSSNPALSRRLCDIPLLDDQALLLRRKVRALHAVGGRAASTGQAYWATGLACSGGSRMKCVTGRAAGMFEYIGWALPAPVPNASSLETHVPDPP